MTLTELRRHLLEVGGGPDLDREMHKVIYFIDYADYQITKFNNVFPYTTDYVIASSIWPSYLGEMPDTAIKICVAILDEKIRDKVYKTLKNS